MSFDGCPFVAARFNLHVDAGEAFWIPFLHKDGEPTWNLLFEAKPGGDCLLYTSDAADE